MKGDVATVEEVTQGIWKVCSVTIHTICPVPPSNFINILKDWGHTWIYNGTATLGRWVVIRAKGFAQSLLLCSFALATSFFANAIFVKSLLTLV